MREGIVLVTRDKEIELDMFVFNLVDESNVQERNITTGSIWSFISVPDLLSPRRETRRVEEARRFRF